MSKKPESTIKPKPEVAAIEDWIGGANQNRENAPSVTAVGPESLQETQPDRLPASQPAGKPSEQEATAMLSVRIARSLHKRLRVHCATHDAQIQDIVSRLLSDYLGRTEEAAPSDAPEPSGRADAIDR